MLYIMCGLPFAGKSTTARALASLSDAEIVEIDAINAELDWGTPPFTPDQWARSYAEAYGRVRAALAEGRNVIFDATNHSRAQRDAARQLASESGVAATVVHVPVDRREAERRLMENRRTRVRPDVTDADFALVADGFEPPDEWETVRPRG